MIRSYLIYRPASSSRSSQATAFIETDTVNRFASRQLEVQGRLLCAGVGVEKCQIGR